MELAERMNDHRTIAYDLFAMVCDDAVARGAEPVLIGSILDVNSLGKEGETHLEQIRQLAEGYIGAAKAANVVIVNGEVAELGNRVNLRGSKIRVIAKKLFLAMTAAKINCLPILFSPEFSF